MPKSKAQEISGQRTLTNKDWINIKYYRILCKSKILIIIPKIVVNGQIFHVKINIFKLDVMTLWS